MYNPTCTIARNGNLRFFMNGHPTPKEDFYQLYPDWPAKDCLTTSQRQYEKHLILRDLKPTIKTNDESDMNLQLVQLHQMVSRGKMSTRLKSRLLDVIEAIQVPQVKQEDKLEQQMLAIGEQAIKMMNVIEHKLSTTEAVEPKYEQELKKAKQESAQIIAKMQKKLEEHQKQKIETELRLNNIEKYIKDHIVDVCFESDANARVCLQSIRDAINVNKFETKDVVALVTNSKSQITGILHADGSLQLTKEPIAVPQDIQPAQTPINLAIATEQGTEVVAANAIVLDATKVPQVEVEVEEMPELEPIPSAASSVPIAPVISILPPVVPVPPVAAVVPAAPLIPLALSIPSAPVAPSVPVVQITDITTASSDERGDLLAAIRARAGQGLKKAPESVKIEDERGDLLAAIRARRQDEDVKVKIERLRPSDCTRDGKVLDEDKNECRPPANNADCALINSLYPYFNPLDQKCYLNARAATLQQEEEEEEDDEEWDE